MEGGKWNKFRDDVTHDGHKIDWGRWAITGQVFLGFVLV